MTASRAKQTPLLIGGNSIAAGETASFDLPVAVLPTHTPLHLPICVVNGPRPGPRIWLSAAVHGDELNGIKIISRVLEQLRETPLLRGAVVAVPIVNVFGFIGQSRYLPDRRDLNRSFPGSKKGSLAGRLAHLFMEEVVAGCSHGIDLHTAARDRSNFPQVRTTLDNPANRKLAESFGAPALVDASLRQGSLRAAASRLGIPVIVFEGGEALRFEEPVIRVGVAGILRVLGDLGMIRKPRGRRSTTLLVDKSSWVRARVGGLFRLDVEEGGWVKAGERIGSVSDPLGENDQGIRAPFDGLVLGTTRNPVVHAGDALVHVGRVALPAD